MESCRGTVHGLTAVYHDARYSLQLHCLMSCDDLQVMNSCMKWGCGHAAGKSKSSSRKLLRFESTSSLGRAYGE